MINKPLFVAARLIGFPLSYVAYARDRGALDARQLLLQAPPRLHGPLSVAHAAMYGLMLFWGYRMFFPRPADAAAKPGRPAVARPPWAPPAPCRQLLKPWPALMPTPRPLLCRTLAASKETQAEAGH